MSTLSLGGIVLNPSMVIEDRNTSQGVAQSVKRTLGGGLVLFSMGLYAGRSLDLVAGEDHGWLSYATVLQLQDLAAQPGGVFELLVNGVGASVVFRHHEPPAFAAKPLVFRHNQQADDPHTCTIKLLTV